MQTTVTWNGHSNFLLRSEKVSILIDPFFEHNPAAPCSWESLGKIDLVLLTHDHDDHVGQAAEICRSSGAQLGAIVGTGERMLAAGVAQEQIINGIGFNIGGTVHVNGAAVTMTEAFHSSESGFPVGYIITMPGGFTVYHAGDTGIFANMQVWGELFPIDLALLPIGGVYTMDARQAAHACRLLGAKQVIPMHYATFPVLEQSPEKFAAELAKAAPECRPLILKPGESAVFRHSEP
ncbi:MAG: metal-dependent hydrolase [Desulfovibrionaceae bacterium]|nr:metal-dependent hydrolase [Desulfovibrionaceae bacterium]